MWQAGLHPADLHLITHNPSAAMAVSHCLNECRAMAASLYAMRQNRADWSPRQCTICRNPLGSDRLSRIAQKRTQHMCPCNHKSSGPQRSPTKTRRHAPPPEGTHNHTCTTGQLQQTSSTKAAIMAYSSCTTAHSSSREHIHTPHGGTNHVAPPVQHCPCHNSPQPMYATGQRGSSSKHR